MSYQNKPYIPKITRKILTFDVEGYRDFYKDRMVAYLCGVWDGNFFMPFRGDRCMKEFIDRYITHRYRGNIFYAHFGSLFDFPMLLQELQDRPDLNIYPITKGSKIIKLTLKDDNDHQWYFHDSSALLNFSLAELTKTFKVSHKKLEVVKKDGNYDKKLYELYKKNPKLVIEYLMHDCKGLYEVIFGFKQKMLDIGGDLGLTIASTSLKTFKRGYQKNVLMMCDRPINDELRNAYFGGRTEIFRMYAPEIKGKYYFYYDINSLYPFVMHENDFPVSKPQVIVSPDDKVYLENEGITKAHVVTPDKLYVPVLPTKIKLKTDTKLMFVLGSYDGWWDNALLRKAKELGYRITPQKSYIFQTDYIFKDFVEHFYSIKENSDSNTPMYLIAKLLMNSLYGKFGQRQDSEFMIKDPKPDEDEYEIIDYVDLDTGWVKVKQESKGKSFLPQISIHVTAMAQLKLLSAIEYILDKGYYVYYCDTDSITTDYPNMPVSKKLGDFKREKLLHSAIFLLPKTYKVTEKVSKDMIKSNPKKYGNKNRYTEVRAKGYSKNLREKISSDAFERALLKDDYSGFDVRSDKKEMIRPLASFHRKNNFVGLDYVRRSLQTKYNKRKILDDFNTVPFTMKELLK
jgi:hypothetical protein